MRPKLTRVRPPVVWIVGASRGIGEAIAQEFAAVGAELCLSGRDRVRLDALAARISAEGGSASAFPCDLRDGRSIRRAAGRILGRFGKIDVLVNNGGVTVFRSFAGTSVREFEQILDTNLLGPIGCIKAVLPGMMKRRSGWIINILSTAAVKIFTGSSAYSASKGGLLALSNVLREELRSSRIKVVNILPGATETGMWSSADRRRHGARMMRARSVAEAVLAAYRMPPDVVVEDLLLRPIDGDVG